MQIKSSVARGDTIVEVMFAIAVFALLAVGCLAIMNRGIETTMRSLEITQARQVMNDQAELLRYAQQDSLLRSSHGTTGSDIWTKVVARTNTRPSTDDMSTACADNSTLASRKAFSLYLNKANKVTLDTSAKKFISSATGASAYPKTTLDSGGNLSSTNGTWIEAVAPGGADHFVDFYIRACWSAPGSDIPVTLGTIVRLYKK